MPGGYGDTFNSYDPYEILGVSRQDDINKITQIYRKLALKYHPDKNKNNKESEEKFKTISKAYQDILKKKYNPNKHTDYKNNFINKINYLKNLLFNIKNIEVSSILTNLIKEFNVMADLYNEKNDKLDKTTDLNINANIDIFDIYNSIEKTITIELLRKCNNCFGSGLVINNKNICTICEECDGLKIMNKKIDLVFNCKFKMNIFSGMSNHSLTETPGNIIVNILPKFITNSELTGINLGDYEIINYYDLLYKYYKGIDEIIDEITDENNTFKLELLHLDNKKYRIEISNPILHYRYKFDNMGLLYNDSDTQRGCLYIVIINYSNYSTDTNETKPIISSMM